MIEMRGDVRCDLLAGREVSRAGQNVRGELEARGFQELLRPYIWRSVVCTRRCCHCAGRCWRQSAC